MLFWTLQITVISIILIFLVHHLILFFKSTLTVPKVKDLVHAPAQKYENIYNTISSRDFSSKDYTDTLLPSNIGLVPPVHDVKSMKDELKNFLKSKASSSDAGTTNITTLDAFSSPNFSSY